MHNPHKLQRWLALLVVGTLAISVRYCMHWRGFVSVLDGRLSQKCLGERALSNEKLLVSRPSSTHKQEKPYTMMGFTISMTFALLCGRRYSESARRRSHAAVSVRHASRERYEGAPIAPPPDLPSLLLKNRIVYLGAPITSEVTELVVAQLLYLNYESAEKPVTMYINSTGSTLKNSTKYVGENKVGMETDAFAIADCMQYIQPQVNTIAIGQAYGTAAMLLALGTKGKRFALPNTTIMLSEPREPPARGPRQASDIRILAREVLHNRTTMAEQIAKSCGKTTEEVIKDTQRCKYMSPEEAVKYNLIDTVLSADKLKEHGSVLPSLVSAM